MAISGLFDIPCFVSALPPKADIGPPLHQHPPRTSSTSCLATVSAHSNSFSFHDFASSLDLTVLIPSSSRGKPAFQWLESCKRSLAMSLELFITQYSIARRICQQGDTQCLQAFVPVKIQHCRAILMAQRISLRCCMSRKQRVFAPIRAREARC